MSSNQNNQSPIGVYDSGSGGLSVLKELKRTLPNESFIYFGDTKRMPYGDKTPSQLMSFCLGILDYFETKNVKAVISACNTSSAAVLPNLAKTYPFEIFGMIEPTSKYVANLNFRKVGIIATAATIKTSAYKISIEKINNNTEVIQQPCPGLVELIESNKADSQECFSLLKSYIEPLLKQDIQAVVLGCTHYPILESMIHEITNHKIIIINPALVVAKSVKDNLEKQNLLSPGTPKETVFYASKNPQLFEEVGRQLYSGCKNAKLLEL